MMLTVWLVARLWTNFAYFTAPTPAAFMLLAIFGSLILTHEVIYHGCEEEG